MADPQKNLRDDFARYTGLTVTHSAQTEDIILRNLTLTRPDTGEILISPFDLTVKRGEKLVLTGMRGCGKSTLLRAIAGLPGISGAGEIIVPAHARILPVPQKPYLPDITMRGILSYPDPAGVHTDEEMTEALYAVGLGRYVSTIKDEEKTGARYATQFSLGEQQALIFARVLLYKPDVLMLDEVTASLDKNSRMDLYRLLLEKLPGTTVLSVAHNEELIPLHDRHGHIENKAITVRPVAQNQNNPLPPGPIPG